MGNMFSSGKFSVNSNADSYNYLSQKIDQLRDSCIDLFKEFFEKLLPLTHLIGQFICHAVVCLENCFLRIGVFTKVMYFISRSDLARTPAIIIQLMNSFQSDVDATGKKIRHHVTLIKKYFNEVSLKLHDEDWPSGIIFSKCVSSFMKLLESLTEWVTTKAGGNAFKVILRWGFNQMQHLDGDEDCQCLSDLCSLANKYVEETVKFLVTSVGEFKEKTQETIEQYSVPIGQAEILLLSLSLV